MRPGAPAFRTRSLKQEALRWSRRVLSCSVLGQRPRGPAGPNRTGHQARLHCSFYNVQRDLNSPVLDPSSPRSRHTKEPPGFNTVLTAVVVLVPSAVLKTRRSFDGAASWQAEETGYLAVLRTKHSASIRRLVKQQIKFNRTKKTF